MSENLLKYFSRLTEIILDCIYSFGNLIFIYSIAVVFFIFFASSTNNLIAFFVELGFLWQFYSIFSFTDCFSVNWYKRLSKISLEISFSSELLTNLKTSSVPHLLLLHLSVSMEAMTSVSSSSFSIPVVHARILLPSN